ncbi:hypothetical protein FDP41_000769 [Naegleria fowleri]|uniref:Uncharacterized protein n=1 Tax=Naegleria fowleri TaxID=5763 RepID=A0A6A5CH84_NAEFO|nr:uncharacterized protein FDP41_000769 [Naegleria fowleri]KAF0984870.1 hypothetical protein FDP41_000769 [Naegleria fowleri]CAG4714697.1 unnamed protein product [Naegleria fowleri]
MESSTSLTLNVDGNNSISSPSSCIHITSSTSSPSLLMSTTSHHPSSSSQNQHYNLTRTSSATQKQSPTSTPQSNNNHSHHHHRSFKQFFSKLATLVKPNPSKKKKKKKEETTSNNSSSSSLSGNGTHLQGLNEKTTTPSCSSSQPPPQVPLSNAVASSSSSTSQQQQHTHPHFMFSSVIAKTTRDSRTKVNSTSSTSLPDSVTTVVGAESSCTSQHHSPLTNTTALSISPRMASHSHHPSARNFNHSSSTICNEEDLDLDWDDVVEDLEKFSSFNTTTMMMNHQVGKDDHEENKQHCYQDTHEQQPPQHYQFSVQNQTPVTAATSKYSKRRHTTHVTHSLFSGKSYHHSAFSSPNKMQNSQRSKRESSKSENPIKDFWSGNSDLDMMLDFVWITDGPTTTSTTMENVNRKKNPSLLDASNAYNISVDTNNNQNGNNSTSLVQIKSTSASNLYSSLSSQEFEDFSFSPGCLQTSSSIIAL